MSSHGTPTSSSAHTEKQAGEDAGVPEWRSRGYLPHRDSPGLVQAVTFRLADSLPQERLAQLDVELRRLPRDRRNAQRRLRIESWLDSGIGCCALRHSEVAAFVQNSLLNFDGTRYHLIAWCIMPNHVHVLVKPAIPLAGIVQGWKSFTSRWVLCHHQLLRLDIPDPHRFWMREYFDRYMRDEDHLVRTAEYIHNNPVKAGLCDQAKQWRWSSAWNADISVAASIQ